MFSLAVAMIGLLWGIVQTAFVSPLSTAGYKDFSFDDVELEEDLKVDAPSGEKPQSKLWWHDGYWWGVLYNAETDHFHIYRLNWGDQEWVDSGVQVDGRRDDPFQVPPKEPENVKVDVLWDEDLEKLYVASHVFTKNGSRTSNSLNRGLLFRYTYDENLQTYVLDTADGFTVDGIQINEHKSETLVLAKDSVGRMWTAFIARPQGSDEHQLIVTHSNGEGQQHDSVWNKDGIALPFTQTFVSSSDIATVFPIDNQGTPSIGVLWSNEVSNTLHLAFHTDGDGPTSGWVYEEVPTPFGMDDHLAARVTEDGRLFISVKASPTNNGDPQIQIIARDNDISSTYTIAGYSTKAHDNTRPTLVLDEGDLLDPEDDQVHVFVTGKEGGSSICYKSDEYHQTNISGTLPLSETLDFTISDCGTPFMADIELDRIDDAASTKQAVNDQTGLVVIGSDSKSYYYVHNQMGDPIPVVFPFGPDRGAVDVAPDAHVVATFNKPMRENDIDEDSFTVEDSDGVQVTGVITYDSDARTATFAPDTPLMSNETYTVKLTDDIRDTGNTRLNEGISNQNVREHWSFTAVSPTVQYDSASYSVFENAAQATVTLTLSTESATPVSVDYGTMDITAASFLDYTPVPSTTITFNPGELTKTVTIDILDDILSEGNEDIRLALSSPISASIGLVPTATLTIFDDEVPPTVQFSSADFSTVEDSGSASVTVSVFPTPTVNIEVDIATVDGVGTASPVIDYTPMPTQTIMIAPGELTKTVPVQVSADLLNESDETIMLRLGNAVAPSGIVTPTIGAISETMLIILDDDVAPSVEFSAPQFDVLEGDGTATVEATLSAASGLTVTVDFATSDGLARDTTDYGMITGTLTFPPGSLSQTFDVTIVDDTMDENLEDIVVTLSNPANAVLGLQEEAAVMIEDNDDPVEVAFEAASFVADEAGVTGEAIVVLSAISGKTVTVDYATSDDTAIAGSDYISATGTVTFTAGTISQTVSIEILDDIVGEPTETFDITLSNAGPTADDAVLGAQATTAMMIDDDDQIEVFFNPATITQTESSLFVSIDVQLTGAATDVATVDYETMDGTAVAGEDYSATSGTLSFAPGQTIQTIQIAISDDTTDEEVEAFHIVLSNATEVVVSLQDTATVNITDDDDAPTISFAGVNFNALEGNLATVTVELSEVSGREVTVDYVTSDGTAVAGVDYVSTIGTVTVVPGERTATFTIELLDNEDKHSDPKTINVAIGNPTNADLGLNTATVSIKDDDSATIYLPMIRRP
ncbi:MAG: Calx-beta domain-containing protein [Chloroflexota bacterium]